MFNLPLSISFCISILFCHFLSPLPHPTLCVLSDTNLPLCPRSCLIPCPVPCPVSSPCPLPYSSTTLDPAPSLALSLTSFLPFLPSVSLAHIPCPLSCLVSALPLPCLLHLSSLRLLPAALSLALFHPLCLTFLSPSHPALCSAMSPALSLPDHMPSIQPCLLRCLLPCFLPVSCPVAWF